MKENSKPLRHWSLWGEQFPAERASNAENISIWWRHNKNQQTTRKRELPAGTMRWIYFHQQTKIKYDTLVINTLANQSPIVMTSSNGNVFRVTGPFVRGIHGNIFCVTGPLCGEFIGHLWIPLTKVIDAELSCFLWSAPWINGWVNNREAGDLRCHHAHYDIIVMYSI